MSTPPTPRSKVFISYSHDDAVWLERLQDYLKPLEGEGKIEPHQNGGKVARSYSPNAGSDESGRITCQQ